MRRLENKYCSQHCQNDLYYKEYIERWKLGLEKGTRGKTAISAHIKRYLKETRGEKCERCGWCERNPFTGKIPVEVEHIDGKWDNNKEENLLLLCPNCHSLTSTYKSLNAGNGRHFRKWESAAGWSATGFEHQRTT